MAECPINSASETIADYIYRYGSQQQFPGNSEDIFCMDFVSTDFSIIYTPLDTVEMCIRDRARRTGIQALNTETTTATPKESSTAAPVITTGISIPCDSVLPIPRRINFIPDSCIPMEQGFNGFFRK